MLMLEVWVIILVVILLMFNIWVLHLLAEEHATLMAILNNNLSKIFQKLK